MSDAATLNPPARLNAAPRPRRRSRAQTGWSVAELAAKIGVSYDTIRRRINEGVIPAKTFGPKTTRVSHAVACALVEHGLNGLPDWLRRNSA